MKKIFFVICFFLFASTAWCLDLNSPNPHTSLDVINGVSARGFGVSPRTALSTFPVPVFRPSTADTVLALDLCPNGSPVENSNGFTWFDVVDTDCLTGNPAMNAARVGITSTNVEFGSRTFNGGSIKPLYLTMDGSAVISIGTDKNISAGDSTGINGKRSWSLTNYSNGSSAYTAAEIRSDNYATKYLGLRHYSSTYAYDSGNYADKSQIAAAGSDLIVESSNDIWILPGGGAYSANNNGVQITTLATLPKIDNNQTIGSASKRWSAAYATIVYPGAGTVKWTSGAGTPEGSVTAPIGSMYTRSDGGAGTTLYIKESGTGNTGWVAK